MEGRLPLPPVPYTNLRLTVVVSKFTPASLVPLHSQLHIPECVCSPVLADLAPAGHSAHGPRSQPGTGPRQSHWPHESIPSGSILQLAGSVQALRECVCSTPPRPHLPRDSALLPPPWSQVKVKPPRWEGASSGEEPEGQAGGTCSNMMSFRLFCSLY